MTTNPGAHYSPRQRGFTLAEALMATVVLAIAAAGVLLPFASGARVRAEGMHRTLGAKLASDLMEEIITKPFLDPDGSAYDYHLGPDSGEITFDNIDDFHGYSESQGQIRDASGGVFTDRSYARFSRDVSCQYATVPQQPPQSEPEQCNFIRVTVQVYYSGKKIATIDRLVSE
ncbi:MAG: hypothetical protein AMJ75_09455 [Phycisphaerae bacterium SM1_79]|nr:MAG: hypothetical protein AMJ75_09455 [Phycisphaerae bacterium SM1_79]